jgi:hypothetical protein
VIIADVITFVVIISNICLDFATNRKSSRFICVACATKAFLGRLRRCFLSCRYLLARYIGKIYEGELSIFIL